MNEPSTSPTYAPDRTRVDSASADSLELSVVIPCLNEADTIGTCIRKALTAMEQAGISGEVVVADNGSNDGSVEIAKDLGARVIDVVQRGYGSALMAGIADARGEFVIMGDADDSYDFLEIPRFVEQLRRGDDIVQGCRFPSGGGKIAPGAMPKLHRWFGNPLLSMLARHMFPVQVHDVYCGMRGFKRAEYLRLQQRCTGMEFAVEMLIKASLLKMRIGEVPITLHPDGRRAHPPHLRTFRDGWRTLRLFLLFSPRWLFVVPGLLLILLGVVGYALALPNVTLFGATFDAHTLLCGSLFLLLGAQSVSFGVLTKIFAVSEGLLPPNAKMEWMLERVSFEGMLLCGLLSFLAGMGLVSVVAIQWWRVDFGPLDYHWAMRWVIPGVTLSALSFQCLFAVCLGSMLRMRRR